MPITKETIKKQIKYWDIFIIILVIISVYFIIHNYLKEVTPLSQSKFETINLVITLIFVFDLVMRLYLYGKEYLFSTEFLIDFFACSDIISPALKAARTLKYSRLLRLARMLRVFRGLKILKSIDLEPAKAKMFNYLGIVTLLAFILASMGISKYLNNKIIRMTTLEFESFLEVVTSQIVKDDKVDIKKFNELIFQRGKVIQDITAVSILTNPNQPQVFQFISKKELKDTFFHDEILTVSNDIISITFAIKMQKLYVKHIELLIILSALPLIVIQFMIIAISGRKKETEDK